MRSYIAGGFIRILLREVFAVAAEPGAREDFIEGWAQALVHLQHVPDH